MKLTEELPLAVTRLPGSPPRYMSEWQDDTKYTITGRLVCDFTTGTLRDAGPGDAVNFETTVGNLEEFIRAFFADPSELTLDFAPIEERMLAHYKGIPIVYGKF